MAVKKYILLFLLALNFDSYSQDSLIHYGGMQQFGVCVNEKNTRFNFTFINGVRYHRFFVGLGADILFRSNSSYYQTQLNSSALFLDGRYYINKKKNFFAKVNGGVNLITENFSSDDNNKYKKRSGAFTSAGIGFKARLGNEVFYTFDLNYCYRQSIYSYSYKYNFGWNSEWRNEKFDLRQYALLLNMGIEFF